MKIYMKICLVLLAAALLLQGCSMTTVDQMYAPPERSEVYLELQSAINAAMYDKDFSSPRSGENQQTVQSVDLTGDGVMEYVVFARDNSGAALWVLIFTRQDDRYVLMDTVECHGTSFDQVEYVALDQAPGMEIVVGSQLADDVVRVLSVYSFAGGSVTQLMTTNYTEFYPLNLSGDERPEIAVLRPGDSGEGNGVAEFYAYVDGAMERSVEVNMSQSAEKIKRIIPGSLNDGFPALYVASEVDETSIITDVFAVVNGVYTNVTFSNESGTSVQTLRNYFVYAEDIDKDGIIELPDLIAMTPQTEAVFAAEKQHLIRWYSMDSDGREVDKLYTYHSFGNGWYVILNSEYASRLSVMQDGVSSRFFLWDDSGENNYPVMTIYSLTGQNREELAEGKVLLYKGDSVIYAADLDVSADDYSSAAEELIANFHLIQRDWKTGET